MNVLFVCTGNVCRSPMAEGFLRHEAAGRGLDLSVRSTGTHAWPGRAATIDGRRTMNEIGVSIDDHRTLVLDERLIDWADLVVGMSREHVRDTCKEFPSAKGKTFLIKEIVEALPAVEEMNGDAGSWVAELGRTIEALDPLGHPDVDDPLGERRTAYMRVATEIQHLIEAMAEGLQAKKVGAASG